MTLLTFLLTLVVIGIIWWVVRTYVPMPDVAKRVGDIVFVVVVICLLLALFRIMPLPFALK